MSYHNATWTAAEEHGQDLRFKACPTLGPAS